MTRVAIEPASVIVGMADCAVSNDPDAVLVTYGLGSCIAVAVYDPVSSVGGLLHFMLPDSSLDFNRGRTNPARYADTGVRELLNGVTRLGGAKERLIVQAAGGAQVLDEKGFFSIGKKNHAHAREALLGAGLRIHAESIGGTVSRSVRLEIRTGRVMIREGILPKYGSKASKVRP